MDDFPTTTAAIRQRLDAIDPTRYAATRNAVDGAVTRLGPYLTHGALTLPEVRDAAYRIAGRRASYRLVFELAWREYFQRLWWEQGEAIFADRKRPQPAARDDDALPSALVDAATGIAAVDAAVRALYDTGYVHNHARLWTAMVGVNVAQARWGPLARWYHYHLLDGDPASNALSWQWVAGTSSDKPYRANQENLNAFDPAHRQTGTFLDVPYDALPDLPIPDVLRACRTVALPCALPESDPVVVPRGADVLLYHPWSLHPAWRADEAAVRVLVLEPSHFDRHPIAPRRVAFLMALARNIDGLRVFVGSADALPGLTDAARVRRVAHPATRHWPGAADEPAWLFDAWPKERLLPGSFMGFWKKVEAWL